MTVLADSPGTLALPTAEVGRFALFTLSLAALRQPPNSMLNVQASASVTQNLNSAASMLRDEDEWFAILGDDHVFRNDWLMTMLEIMDDNPHIDILVPLVVKRNPPWEVGLFHEHNELSEDGTPLFKQYTWPEIPEETEFPVDAAGNAGMVMRRHVVDAMTEGGEPLFYSTVDSKGRQVVLNEDVTFCTRARHEHNFTLYATSNAFLGHIGVFNVRPLYREGRWGALAEFSSPDEQLKELFMPVADLEEDHVVAHA